PVPGRGQTQTPARSARAERIGVIDYASHFVPSALRVVLKESSGRGAAARSGAMRAAQPLAPVRCVEVDQRPFRHDAERIAQLAQRKVALLVEVEKDRVADAVGLIK